MAADYPSLSTKLDPAKIQDLRCLQQKQETDSEGDDESNDENVYYDGDDDNDDGGGEAGNDDNDFARTSEPMKDSILTS